MNTNRYIRINFAEILNVTKGIILIPFKILMCIFFTLYLVIHMDVKNDFDRKFVLSELIRWFRITK